jgi:hypothetical protein
MPQGGTSCTELDLTERREQAHCRSLVSSSDHLFTVGGAAASTLIELPVRPGAEAVRVIVPLEALVFNTARHQPWYARRSDAWKGSWLELSPLSTAAMTPGPLNRLFSCERFGQSKEPAKFLLDSARCLLVM